MDTNPVPDLLLAQAPNCPKEPPSFHTLRENRRFYPQHPTAVQITCTEDTECTQALDQFPPYKELKAICRISFV